MSVFDPHETEAIGPDATPEVTPPPLPTYQPASNYQYAPGSVAPASRGLSQLFGLHPMAALMVIMVDSLLFGGEILSAGLLIVFSVFASVVLGWIVYGMQRKWYGDDHETAMIKAVAMGLVTAIPTPVTPLLAIPTGAVGCVGLLFRRK